MIKANSSTTKTTKQVKLPANWVPSKYDIICGRGSIAQQNEGNQRLKALVQSCLQEYNACKCKFQKTKLVSSIVETVQQASPQGGFVKFVDDGWVRVTDRHCREKVGQLFRDALHMKYKSSTKAKSQMRRKKNGENCSSSSSSSDSVGSHNKATKALHQLLQEPPRAIPSSIVCLEVPLATSSPTISKPLSGNIKPSSERANSFSALNDLPNFVPDPIGEDSMENLFNLDFTATRNRVSEASPFPLSTSAAAGDESISQFCDVVFEQL